MANLVFAQTTSENIISHYQTIQALTPTDESEASIPDEPPISPSALLSMSLFVFFFVVVFLGFFPLILEKFRNFKRFQSALVVAFIAGSIPLTLGLALQRSTFFTQASQSEIPKNVVISDVSQNSFKVTWETESEEYGALRFGTDPYTSALDSTVLEEGGLNRKKQHMIVINQLEPNTNYYFEVLSGSRWYDNNGVLPQVHSPE